MQGRQGNASLPAPSAAGPVPLNLQAEPSGTVLLPFCVPVPGSAASLSPPARLIGRQVTSRLVLSNRTFCPELQQRAGSRFLGGFLGLRLSRLLIPHEKARRHDITGAQQEVAAQKASQRSVGQV